MTNLLPAEKVLTSVGKIKVLNAAEFNKLYKGTGLNARTASDILKRHNNIYRSLLSFEKHLLMLDVVEF